MKVVMLGGDGVFGSRLARFLRHDAHAVRRAGQRANQARGLPCPSMPISWQFPEPFWLFTYGLDLPVIDGTMALPVWRDWFLGLPLPSALLPGSDSGEYVRGGLFHFDVTWLAPLGGGLIACYRGSLRHNRTNHDPLGETVGYRAEAVKRL